jgi:ankyrin repeat protein
VLTCAASKIHSIYPLFLAIENGHFDVVDTLVFNNVDLYQIESTPPHRKCLHLAASVGHPQIFTVLQENLPKEECFASDSLGNTPLHYARNQEIVNKLLQIEADKERENNNG